MKWNQYIEHRHDLRAHVVHGGNGDDEDKVIAANVADERVFRADALGDVVQNLRENPDDAVSVMVGVAVIELLEVIEVGVTHCKRVTGVQPPLDVGFDLDRARQTRRRMHGQIAIGPAQHRVQTNRDLL